ncbi:MAG: S41 family peptidase [Planctomycetota bacterium]|nr:S41 family peptidase [Planctomycetota bacterium]
MPKRNIILLCATCLVSLIAVMARERGGPGRRFGEVVAAIERHYIEPVEAERLVEVGLEAAVDQLDDNSAYLRGAGREALESSLDQRFGGVGLELVVDAAAGQPVVVSPVVDSPAWRAGLAAGDQIVAVDGRTTAGHPLRETVERLRGRVGEPVVLAVVSPRPVETLDPAAVAEATSAEREVRLIREVVEVESVYGDRRRPDGSWDWMLEGEPGVAYLRIDSFGERTAEEFAEALAAVAVEPELRGLVIDLRGNPGGLLEAAVAVCDELLAEGVIVVTRGRGSGGDAVGSVSDQRRATSGAILEGVPLAVLVDSLTASAGEIVAACLQDTGRATIVGSRTFGKGTVQSLLPLSDGRGLLKLTTSEYLRPSLETIHRRPGADDAATWGVRPDEGYEAAPTAAAVERLRSWRRRRGMVPPRGATVSEAGPSPILPREIDSVLARALEALDRGSG